MPHCDAYAYCHSNCHSNCYSNCNRNSDCNSHANRDPNPNAVHGKMFAHAEASPNAGTAPDSVTCN